MTNLIEASESIWSILVNFSRNFNEHLFSAYIVLIYRQTPGRGLKYCRAQVQVQVPGQVPGQVQKVQGLRAKDLDLG